VRAPAALEGIEMWMSVLLTRLVGVPEPAAEIAALRWWPRDGAIGLAPAVRDYVIPRLRCAGQL
jgi:8-oxo-dGTP diphosphatase